MTNIKDRYVSYDVSPFSRYKRHEIAPKFTSFHISKASNASP
jgi:hypothetical protein